ncbi:RinA family phage transcriptional activator [Acetoanaerobium pronyense]|uniref:RinA family phage transcriptional activator n=1 Tax=Acetoanaerobium pronyense TaxID=1482736 RepID=A0ABS4KI14_9FIRM|nr:sigma factor-like helix-turn-helix DNA-binding protein [Acetoanaerobium pronyense]MBP2027422.1 RinA family phage transcriptional activator [Acetoanaerobium pronyense]
MKKETIKKILLDYPYTKKEKEKLNNDLKDLLGSKYETSVTAQLTEAISGNRSISNKTEQAVIKISEIYDHKANLIKNKINILLKNQYLIEESLERLEHDQKKIIELRYFQRYKWEIISKKLKYSISNCYKLHDKALNKLSIEFERGGKNWKQ